jgi:hypothetical protein
VVVDDETLALKLALLRPHLNERQWRLLLDAEAEAIGRGGISLVARWSSRTTVQTAVNEVTSTPTARPSSGTSTPPPAPPCVVYGTGRQARGPGGSSSVER